MFDLRCSRPAVSISMSISFCPSTIATRSSSCCVALNNMRFIFITPRPVGHLEAASWEAAKVQGYMRERECRRGKCLSVRSNNVYYPTTVRTYVTAATGAVRSIVMPSAQRTCNSSDTARVCVGGRECKRTANSEPNRQQAHYRGRDGEAWPQPIHRQPQVAAYGVWRKRQALSTSSTHEPDLISRANGYLSLQSNTLSSASVRLIRLQLRCNLDSRRDGAYTFFSTEFAIWRGRWRRPCVKCAFILTPAAARAAAKTIIYSK